MNLLIIEDITSYCYLYMPVYRSLLYHPQRTPTFSDIFLNIYYNTGHSGVSPRVLVSSIAFPGFSSYGFQRIFLLLTVGRENILTHPQLVEMTFQFLITVYYNQFSQNSHVVLFNVGLNYIGLKYVRIYSVVDNLLCI